jgi:RimJ/RimL family protein N-acetyltransferase
MSETSTPFTSDIAIETERLLLLPTDERYAQPVFENFTPEITTLMFPAPPQAIEETIDFLRSARTSNEVGTDLQVVILHAESREFLGHGGLHHIDTPTPEIGIWIKKAAHRHGYGLEAVRGLASWALANLTFDYLIYPVDRRNAPSRRIPEDLNEAIAREYTQINASGAELDLLEYRIEPSLLAAHLRKSS